MLSSRFFRPITCVEESLDPTQKLEIFANVIIFIFKEMKNDVLIGLNFVYICFQLCICLIGIKSAQKNKIFNVHVASTHINWFSLLISVTD